MNLPTASAPSLVLASTSPFRRELLERLQLPFVTAAPEVDETALAGETPAATAERLAQEKAQAVAGRFPNALIIGSDQVAHCGGKRYGKPGTRANAVAQLRAMRGQAVTFDTGLCLLDSASGLAQRCSVPTEVRFRQLSDAEIERYLDRENALNCAGSAKSEGLGIALIESMRGDDPNALVGLPLIALCRMLRQAGIPLP